jgi:hypothetical protein
MTHLVFSSGGLLEHYMWNRWLLIGASDLEMVSYTMRSVGKAIAEAPHLQIIDTCWNTAMQ